MTSQSLDSINCMHFNVTKPTCTKAKTKTNCHVQIIDEILVAFYDQKLVCNILPASTGRPTVKIRCAVIRTL